MKLLLCYLRLWFKLWEQQIFSLGGTLLVRLKVLEKREKLQKARK